MKFKKLIIIVLVLLCCRSIVFSQEVYAESRTNESMRLTLQDAVRIALEHTYTLKEIDKNIDRLWTQRNEMLNTSKKIQEQLDMMAEYENLLKKQMKGENLDLSEKNRIIEFQYIFGPEPPNISLEDMFNNYIKNRDFYHYSLWGSIQNAEINKKSIEANIEDMVYDIFYNIASLKETLTIQEELYNVMLMQYEQLLLKYKSGKVSEIDKLSTEMDLERQRINIGKLKRNIQNIEMSMKKQLGIPILQNIEWIYDKEDNLKSLLPYEDYLQKALNNNLQIVNANVNLDVKQREYNILKEYIRNEWDLERRESEQAFNDKRLQLKETRERVVIDTYNRYKEVKIKLENLIILKKKENISQKQHNQLFVLYEKGMTSISSLWSSQTGLSQSKIAYKQAVRDYNNSVRKLELICGIESK